MCEQGEGVATLWRTNHRIDIVCIVFTLNLISHYVHFTKLVTVSIDTLYNVLFYNLCWSEVTNTLQTKYNDYPTLWNMALASFVFHGRLKFWEVWASGERSPPYSSLPFQSSKSFEGGGSPFVPMAIAHSSLQKIAERKTVNLRSLNLFKAIIRYVRHCTCKCKQTESQWPLLWSGSAWQQIIFHALCQKLWDVLQFHNVVK